MALVRVDDVEREALAERIFLHGALDDGAVDGEDAVGDLRLRADDGVLDADVLLLQRADDFFLARTRSGGGRCGCACHLGRAARERQVDGETADMLGRIDADVERAVVFPGNLGH